MDYWGIFSSILVFVYEIFTSAVRPQYELVSNIALMWGKLIHVRAEIGIYGVATNLNVKIENKPFLMIFRRPISCRAQMAVYRIESGMKHATGDRFDVAPLGKEKGEKIDLDIGIENTIRLLTSSPSGRGRELMCFVPPKGSPLDAGDVEIELILSWGIGSRSYTIGRFRLPDLARL